VQKKKGRIKLKEEKGNHQKNIVKKRYLKKWTAVCESGDVITIA